MTLSIRTFCNRDIPDLCRIWNATQNTGDRTATLSVQRMELFVHAKPYFELSHILVAENDQSLLGFLHLCPIPDDQLTQANPEQLGIAALAVMPGQHQSYVAMSLLQAAESYGRSRGAIACRFRPAMPQCSYYLGIGPADSLAGVLAVESNLCQWLTDAGYRPAVPTTVWELDLMSFHVPADRLQMLVRRSSYVQRQLEEPTMPWWQSCVLGHAETTAFHLTDRETEHTLQEVLMWSISPDLRRHPETVVWVWPPCRNLLANSGTDVSQADRLLFLLGESFRDLQKEQIDTVRTVTSAEANELHRVLIRLGFVASESGVVFERNFD